MGGAVGVVDSDPSRAALVAGWLERAGYAPRTLGGAPDVGPADWADLDVVSAHAPDGDPASQDLVATLSLARPSLPVVVWGDPVAPNDGAFEALEGAPSPSKLCAALRRGVEHHRLAQRVQHLEAELASTRTARHFVATSEATRELVARARRLTSSTVAFGVYGEPGSGKQLFATWVHTNGTRRDGTCITFTPRVQPRAEHAAELFGGTRTGGHWGRAVGGTLYVEEVDALDHAAQLELAARLARPDRTLAPRVILGTREAAPGTGVAPELSHALDTWVRVPPLRERAADIPTLVGAQLGRGEHASPGVTADALAALAQHDWPGNVRELEAVVVAACLAAQREAIDVHHLPPRLRPLPQSAAANDSGRELRLEVLERRAIERALSAAGGSVTRAAKLLGIGRATLYRRIASLSVDGAA